MLNHLTFPALYLLFIATPVFAQNENVNPSRDELEIGAYAGVISATEALNSLTESLFIGRQNAGASGSPFNQLDVTRPYLPFIDPDFNNPPDDSLERLAIGEVYFLTFAPVMMMLYDEELAKRDDWIGAHAMKRVMQVQFQARGEVEMVRSMVKGYVERFPMTPLDRAGHYQQIFNLVKHDVTKGEVDAAMKLLLATLEATPTNAAYNSYRLVTDFSDLIEHSNQADETRKLIRKKLNGLTKTRDGLGALKSLAKDDPILTGGYPDWYWMYQGRWGNETYNEMRIRQLVSQIKALEDWVAGD